MAGGGIDGVAGGGLHRVGVLPPVSGPDRGGSLIDHIGGQAALQRPDGGPVGLCHPGQLIPGQQLLDKGDAGVGPGDAGPEMDQGGQGGGGVVDVLLPLVPQPV